MKIRALIDIKGSDIKAGEFFETSDEVAAFLVGDGQADDKTTEADVYGVDIPAAKSLEGYEPNVPSPQAAIFDEQAAAAQADDTKKKGKKD